MCSLPLWLLVACLFLWFKRYSILGILERNKVYYIDLGAEEFGLEINYRELEVVWFVLKLKSG